MANQLLKIAITASLFVGQASAWSVRDFFNFCNINAIGRQFFSSVFISGNSTVIINGKVISPNSTEYPKSNAPIKVIEHAEINEKYTDNYDFADYHHIKTSYPFAEQGRLIVENFNGDVIVESADVDNISIDVMLEPPVLKSPVRATIEVDPAGAYAKIKAKHDKQPVCIAAIMKILVPKSTSVHIETANGRVIANDRIGDTDIHTSNGPITACNLKGSTYLYTSNGKINADNLAGAIDLRTSNGTINAHNLDAEDKLSIKTSNGAIDSSLLSAKNIRRADILTSNGHVNLALARTIQAIVHGKTSNGKVRGNIWQQHQSRGREADATLGNGDMHMNIKASNNNIDANFR